MACLSLVMTHFFNQCWIIDTWTPNNKIQRCFRQNKTISTHDIVFKNAILQVSAILTHLQDHEHQMTKSIPWAHFCYDLRLVYHQTPTRWPSFHLGAAWMKDSICGVMKISPPHNKFYFIAYSYLTRYDTDYDFLFYTAVFTALPSLQDGYSQKQKIQKTPHN